MSTVSDIAVTMIMNGSSWDQARYNVDPGDRIMSFNGRIQYDQL